MKAMVLAAGYGTRLGDITRETAKPMLPLNGNPLLEYTLRYLAKHGFDQVAINLHFQADQIKNHFGDGAGYGVEIEYSYEPELLGTAGGVKNLEPFFINEEAFLVIYGDLLVDQDLTAVMEFHRQQKADATLVLHQRHNSNSLVCMEADQRLTGFIERPTDKERSDNPYPWVNSGIQILTPRILELIPPGRAVDLPRDIYATQIDSLSIYGFPLTGYRCAIDSPERYRQADEAVRSGDYSPGAR